MQLRKETRYLLADFAGSANHKKYYRRGGVVFKRGQPTLIDLEAIKKEKLAMVFRDPAIRCRELSAKDAEKFLATAKLDDEAVSPDKTVAAAFERVKERLAQSEDARTQLESQIGAMADELNAQADQMDELRAQLADLRTSGGVKVEDSKPEPKEKPAKASTTKPTASKK